MKQSPPLVTGAPAWTSSKPPLLRFLNACHADFASETSGAVADYIPELGKADPAHFGISLATLDGHVYEAGDTRIAFTIQSMSKPFVFALALDTLGAARVESAVGVEPSGDPFNSIRLNADNHPFNAMVNAGAITCTSLIREAKGDGAFEYIRQALGRFAGRELAVDEAVFASESVSGDRNRAIAYLLRTSHVIEQDVSAVLETYFRQCAVLVTARDIAVMAATLANRGVNPVTNEQVVAPYAVARTLSVMTSSGMYDYAGEWVYRVGIPAKSGVGGGIIAALPAQFGLGTFSPLLDSHGNSVRGLKVCEELSSHFDLHVLNRSGDVRTSIIADYNIEGIASRRSRQPHEQSILDEHPQAIRVIELIGALSVGTMDYVTRRIAEQSAPALLIIDLRRVPSVTEGAARLLADELPDLAADNVRVVLCGIEKSSSVWTTIGAAAGDANTMRRFDLLDDAIEWAEDQVIYRYGGFSTVRAPVPLAEQALLAGLSPDELNELTAISQVRIFHTGERIITAGDPASSMFFLRSGMISVKLRSGVRLASLAPGMAFGEMALLEEVRTADVWADTLVDCLELQVSRFDAFCERHPRSGQRIVRNLAVLLTKRLIAANAKVDVLSAY